MRKTKKVIETNSKKLDKSSFLIILKNFIKIYIENKKKGRRKMQIIKEFDIGKVGEPYYIKQKGDTNITFTTNEIDIIRKHIEHCVDNICEARYNEETKEIEADGIADDIFIALYNILYFDRIPPLTIE